MPSILKIRVIKARNLIPFEDDENLSISNTCTSTFYSTLKLIESNELLNEASSNFTAISSSSSESETDERQEHEQELRYKKKSFLLHRKQREIESANYPTNFTFKTRNVQCTDGSPKWDEDFRLEVTDDAQLQDTPLQLHLYRETSTWIGSLTLDLNPLLAKDSPYGICGWFPLKTEENGNGLNDPEIFLQAKIQFFGDSNPFKESSAGVQFFCTPEIPTCVKHLAMIGLVEDLLTEHLPSNFSSTALPSHFEAKLVGQLRRQIGKKVLEMGGSAVLSYQQSIEWEPAAKCVTVRGLGTAVKILQRINQQIHGKSLHKEAPFEGQSSSSSSSSSNNSSSNSSSSSSSSSEDELNKAALIEETIKELPAKANTIDLVTISDFPVSVIESIGGIVSARAVKLFPAHEQSRKSSLHHHHHHHQNYLRNLTAIGDFREQWQDELREEIRAHAKTLACNAVIGYTESVSILDDLYILSASGTAVRAAFSNLLPPTESDLFPLSGETVGLDETDVEGDDEMEISCALKKTRKRNLSKRQRNGLKKSLKQQILRRKQSLKGSEALKCSACHLPYRRARAPFTSAFEPCQLCHGRFVPEFIFGTCAVMRELEIIEGVGGLLEAYVCKPLSGGNGGKTGNKSVTTATAISSALPFVEYDLHRQILYKLRISGLNAIFGLSYRLAYTAEMIVAVATGTGLFLAALPRPEPIRISRNLKIKDDEDLQMTTIQSEIIRRSHANRDLIEETFLKKHTKLVLNMSSSSESSESSENESEGSGIKKLNNLNFSSSSDSSSSSSTSLSESDSSSSSSSSDSDIDINDALAVIQIDDDADEDIMAVLLDPKDQSDSFEFLSRGNLDRNIPINSCDVKHVVEISDVIIETMAHHPNLQLAAVFREIYKKLKIVAQPSGFMACIDHQFIADALAIKIITTAIIYHPKMKTLNNNNSLNLNNRINESESETDTDDENVIMLPESFNDVLITSSSQIPGNTLINDYGRVFFNNSIQLSRDQETFNYKKFNESDQILSLINQSLVGLKAFSLAIGGNGICAIRIDQGPAIVNSDLGLESKRIRVSISGDVILFK